MKYYDKHAKREREIRKISDELDKLYVVRYNSCLEKLDKPLRYGWLKELSLRSDIANREDAHVLEEIIRVCGLKVWGRTKDKTNVNWRQATNNRNNQWPGMRRIGEKTYRKLSNEAKKLFIGYEWYWTSYKGSVMRYRLQVPKHYFRVVFVKAYIHFKQVVQSDLERRISELEYKLEKQYYTDYMDWRYRKNGKWIRILSHRSGRKKMKQMLTKLDIEHPYISDTNY
ncbi:MAG: hypothetical protein AAFX87_17395 [Bacteroidota bacterium]